VHRVAFVVFPNFQVMGFASISVFEVANLILREPGYEVTLLSETGGLIRSTAGFSVETAPFDERVFDTVVIAAGSTVEPATPGMLAFVREAAATAQRIAAPCIGAFVLAEAGLLNGRSATTHWMFARDLQARFPEIKVEQDRIFMVDGPVWTSAGMTASIDLALALVERDHGIETARSVARKLVVYHRRAGGQSQFSALRDLEPKSDRIQKALDYAKTNLRSSLSVVELADIASLSPRHFSRAFYAETGQTPAKAVEHLRVEAARLMMEEGRHSMDVIADETGFADRERMRRAFLRTVGQPPQTVRRNARIA
jgi:transcriptional regulator GlxA family with amidase domain